MITKDVNFYSRIEEFRKSEGLTQTAFASLIGMSRESYAHIGNNPTYNRIVAILEVFPKLSSEWLMRGEGDMLRTFTKAEERINLTAPSPNDTMDDLLGTIIAEYIKSHSTNNHILDQLKVLDTRLEALEKDLYKATT